MAPEDVDTLYELIAYGLFRSYPYQKFFMLYGPGANGKSTYLNIIEKLIGEGNISHVTAQELQYNRFASSELFGKFLNLSGECDYSTLKKTSTLKQACGGDTLRCERKFEVTFPFKNYAKLIFNTNQLPPTDDKTDAFYRRIFLVAFPNVFETGENADLLLVDKIPPEEIQGLAYKSVDVLKSLVERNFIFTRNEKKGKLAEQYEKLSNPLDTFLEEHTEPCDYEDGIHVTEFTHHLNDFLRTSKSRRMSGTEISKLMRNSGYESKTKRFNGKFRKAWRGLKWKVKSVTDVTV